MLLALQTEGSLSLAESHYSPMLHNAMVALAISFSDNTRLRDPQVRQLFVNEAEMGVSAGWRVPTLSFVHTLSILSSYYCSLGEYSIGFMYSGMSSRACQARECFSCMVSIKLNHSIQVGLNVDCSPYVDANGITKGHMEDRNWTQWEAFCMVRNCRRAPAHGSSPFSGRNLVSTSWS